MNCARSFCLFLGLLLNKTTGCSFILYAYHTDRKRVVYANFCDFACFRGSHDSHCFLSSSL